MESNLNAISNLSNLFDQVYCINLKSRADRLKKFTADNCNVLKINDIKIIEAVVGKEVIQDYWPHSPGALGCRLSHLKVYQDAIQNKYKTILVLEDDVILNSKSAKLFSELTNFLLHDWDMIYLGSNHFMEPQRLSKKFNKVNGSLACHAIAYKCSSLDKVITHIESDNTWIDTLLCDLHPKMKVYGFNKNVAKQRKGFSDIEEAIVDYNTTVSTKIKNKFYNVLKKQFD